MPARSRLPVLTLLIAGAALFGCGASDPADRVLEQRARWTVQALDWVQLEDGAIHVSTRVSGPPNSKLEQLTVLVDLLDPDNGSLGQHWYTFDLTQVPRGGPKDVPVRPPRRRPNRRRPEPPDRSLAHRGASRTDQGTAGPVADAPNNGPPTMGTFLIIGRRGVA